MSIGSFYKKKTLTKGIDKANQVLKPQNHWLQLKKQLKSNQQIK